MDAGHLSPKITMVRKRKEAPCTLTSSFENQNKLTEKQGKRESLNNSTRVRRVML